MVSRLRFIWANKRTGKKQHIIFTTRVRNTCTRIKLDKMPDGFRGNSLGDGRAHKKLCGQVTENIEILDISNILLVVWKTWEQFYFAIVWKFNSNLICWQKANISYEQWSLNTHAHTYTKFTNQKLIIAILVVMSNCLFNRTQFPVLPVVIKQNLQKQFQIKLCISMKKKSIISKHFFFSQSYSIIRCPPNICFC